MSARLPYNSPSEPGKDLHVEKLFTGPSELELGRQALRRLGILEIRFQVKRMFPLYSRREVRQLAFALHKRAWDGRDVEAVRKVNIIHVRKVTYP